MTKLDDKISGTMLALTRDELFTQDIVDQADGFHPLKNYPDKTVSDDPAYAKDSITTAAELFDYLTAHSSQEIGGNAQMTLGGLLTKHGFPVLNQFTDFNSTTIDDAQILESRKTIVLECQLEAEKSFAKDTVQYELAVAKNIFTYCFSQRGQNDDPTEGTALSYARTGLGMCTENSEYFSAICLLADFKHLQVGYASVRKERDGSIMKMPNGDYVRHVCNFILIRDTSKVMMADLANSTSVAEGWDTYYPDWQPLSDSQMESAYFSNSGSNLLDQKKYDEAKVSLEAAIALDPKNAEAYNGLANFYVTRGAYTESSEMYEQGLAIEPNHQLLLTGYGHLQILENKLEEAETTLRKAVALDPQYIPAQLNLVIVLYKLGKIEESKKGSQTVLDLDPNNQTALTIKSRLESL